jgi:GT2 family glycosyltransferase
LKEKKAPPGPGALVSLITVNFNGKQWLEDHLQALQRQSYPSTEIIVVDNASTDGSADLVERCFPEVRLLRSPRNLGFAGGNNLGMRAARGEFVALVNNDAFPEAHWLEALVAEAQSWPNAAAVASKILFLKRFLPVSLRADTFNPAKIGASSDDRELGVLYDEDSGFVGSRYRKPIYREGFYAPERHGDRIVRWTTGDATVLLPLAEDDRENCLRLRLSTIAGHEGRRVTVWVGSRQLGSTELGLEHEVRLPVPASVVAEYSFDVINNAGSDLDASGKTADRGLYEPDRGQHDHPGDVSAICGAAVLLRRSALEQVGLFDEDFFMYYEDTDLSWRFRTRGFGLRYQPKGVVRHVHAGSSVEWSPTFTYYVARNKVLMIAKNGSLMQLLRAYSQEAGWTLKLLKTWLFQPGSRDTTGKELLVRLRVQRSFVTQIPRAWMKRLGVASESTLEKT